MQHKYQNQGDSLTLARVSVTFEQLYIRFYEGSRNLGDCRRIVCIYGEINI